MLPRPRVLIVDDEPSLLSTLRRAIERIRPDAVVIYASNAENAIWQLQSTTIRTVFTDLSMRGDPNAGLRVVAAAKELNIPVAVITGGELPADASLLRDVPVIRKRELGHEVLAEVLATALAE